MRANRLWQWLLLVTVVSCLAAACASSMPEDEPPSPAEPAAQPTENPVGQPRAVEPPATAASQPAVVAAQPASTPDLVSLVQTAFERMSQGRILYNPPEQMRAGQRERVEVRITQEGSEAGLSEGLQGRGTPTVENIPVATFMKVRLIGPGFDIAPLSSEEQIVAGAGYTQWAWDVTPRKAGEQSLDLVVTARVKLQGYSDEQKDLQIIRRSIQVHVDPGYAVASFLQSNGDWLFPAVVIPVLTAAGAGVWRKLRKPRAPA